MRKLWKNWQNKVSLAVLMSRTAIKQIPLFWVSVLLKYQKTFKLAISLFQSPHIFLTLFVVSSAKDSVMEKRVAIRRLYVRAALKQVTPTKAVKKWWSAQIVWLLIVPFRRIVLVGRQRNRPRKLPQREMLGSVRLVRLLRLRDILYEIVQQWLLLFLEMHPFLLIQIESTNQSLLKQNTLGLSLTRCQSQSCHPQNTQCLLH